MAPPELARDAPGLDVLHPLEIGLFPVLRHERRSRPSAPPRSPAAPCVLASTYHWSVRYGSITTPERSPCGTMCVFGSILLEEAELLQPRHDQLARGEAVDAVQFLRELRRAFRQSAQIVLVVDQREAALLIEHADLRQVVPPADLEIVEVVRRRDLDRARALFGIGIFVGDDRDPAADQRQDDVLADQIGCSAHRPDAPRPRVSPSMVSGRVVATTMKVAGSSGLKVLPSSG